MYTTYICNGTSPLDETIEFGYDEQSGKPMIRLYRKNLENFTERTLSATGKEAESMGTRIKAQLDGHWITATSPQQLVNKALTRQNETVTGKTVRDYCEAHLKLYCSDCAPNTMRGYRDYLKNHIYPAMGDKDIGKITREDVQSYINSKATELCKKTIQEHIIFLRTVFDEAVDDGLIARNPFKSSCLKVKGKPSEKRKRFSDEEFDVLEHNILPILKEQEQLYIGLVMYTGMRRGEIAALQWQDIDLEDGYIHIHQSVSYAGKNKGEIKTTKTENGIRDIMICPQLLDILRRYKRESGCVLRSKKGDPDGKTPLTNSAIVRMTDRIKAAIKEAGYNMDYMAIRFRHNMGTDLLSSGTDLATTARIMGHSDARFTARQYADPQERQLREGMKRVVAYRG